MEKDYWKMRGHSELRRQFFIFYSSLHLCRCADPHTVEAHISTHRRMIQRRSVLHLAAESGDAKTVKALLDAGANKEIKAVRGMLGAAGGWGSLQGEAT